MKLIKPEHRAEIEWLSQKAESEDVRLRARIVLMSDRGSDEKTVADELGIRRQVVSECVRRFGAEGMGVFPLGQEDGSPVESPTDGTPAGSDSAESRPNESSTGASAERPSWADLDRIADASGRPELGAVDLQNPEFYLNRELSLLEFQRRVLEEAIDSTNPLLERVKFLSIVGSNLDEFFMVRVGGLKMQIAEGVSEASPDGMMPAEQLADIRRVSHDLMMKSKQHLRGLTSALADEDIYILNFADLNEKQTQQANGYFEEVIFPILTPMAFDPGHPFPHISNLSLNLAVVIRDVEGSERFARVKVPASIPRLIPLKRSSGSVRKDGTAPRKHFFVWLEQVIAANLDVLFPGMEVLASYPFRVTRNADMVIQELEADDLLETMEKGVRQRRFGAVDRVVVNPDMPGQVRRILVENLAMDSKDCYVLEGALGMSSLMGLYSSVDRPDLKEPPFLPYTPPILQTDGPESDLFGTIARENTLIHHPYDSFGPVMDFLEIAASDPNVLAIKQTLYRVGKNPPIVASLRKARENGKQVTVLLELKARFDEESNIGWARMLEREGVHVVYGLLGLKTHSKIALVVRQEGETIRRYVHLSTGNYNAVTAHLYEDLGFFTADPDIGADASDLFNFLTGYSAKTDYRKLIIAPINLRASIQGRIRREIEHQKAGRGGHLVLKTNALVDKSVIQLLYQASQAGVRVDLIVRGICCLRPGVPGISENITVRSIVGRFLEHSRIYYFRNGGDEEVYLGSADLMPRNINRRVEILFPVEQEHLIRYLKDEVLDTYLADNVKCRMMRPDGGYDRVQPEEAEPRLSAQQAFLERRVRWQSRDAELKAP